MLNLLRAILRFFFPFLILYLIYKLLFGKNRSFRSGESEKRKEQNVENMVKDPICGTYIPETEAKKVKSGGEYYYFCSDDCRQKFIELKKTDSEKGRSHE